MVMPLRLRKTINGKVLLGFTVLVLLVTSLAQEARAQHNTGGFLAWLDQVDQREHADAWAGATRYNADGSFSARDVTINIPSIELSLHLDSVVASQLTLTSEPGFNASTKALQFSGFKLRIGETEFSANIMNLHEVLLPNLQFDTKPGTSPFSAKVQFFSQLLALQAKRVEVPRLIIRKHARKRSERLAEMQLVNTHVTELSNYSLKSWKSSKASLVSPKIEPLIRESYKSISLQNLNFHSLMQLFDNKNTSTNNAPLLTAFTVENYITDIGGMRISLPKVSVKDLNIAPPSNETEQILTSALGNAKGLDSIAESELPGFMLDLVSLISIGSLKFDGMQVAALGIDQFSLDEFSLSNASILKIGNFQISGFIAKLEEIGTLKLGKFGFTDLMLPAKQKLQSAIAGKTPPVSEILPTLASFTLEDFGVSGLGLPSSIEAKTISIAMGQREGSRQEALDLTIDQLKVPAQLIPAKGPLTRLKGIIDTLQLDALEFTQQLEITYNPATRALNVAHMTSDLPNIGSLSIKAAISGLNSSPFANPTNAAKVIRAGHVQRATVQFNNKGVVEAGFDAQAKTLGTNGALLRGQVGATLPFLLGVLQNPEFQKELATALQAFLPNPQGIVVALTPSSAISIADIERQLRRDPRKLISILGVSIRNEPFTQQEPLQETKAPAD